MTSHIVDRVRRRVRLALYLLSFVAVVVAYTYLYRWGMTTLEGRHRTLLESLEIVIQSLTTTGYGQDAPWESRFVSALVMLIQFTGIAYIFIAFPLFVIPWIRETVFEPTVPESVDELQGHVLVCGYSSLGASLVEELESRESEYAIIESDAERARELYEDDVAVMLGNPASSETLADARIADARAIVVDATHQNEIGIVLAVREHTSDVDVLCLVDDPSRSRYMRYAGADTVLSPKHRLGKSLADKARNVVSSDLDDLDDVGEALEIAEFPVYRRSDAFGRPLAEIRDYDPIDATLLGAWVRGEFVTPSSANPYVDETTVLVFAGTTSQLETVRRITRTGSRVPTGGPVIVAGRGLVGLTAEGVLTKAGRETVVVDIDAEEGVDVVGDATDEATLHDADIGEVGTVIVTLSDDETAMLTTLVAREITRDVEIIVAANDSENTAKLYNAGADYVIALPKLSGRMVMHDIFQMDVMTLAERIRLTQTAAPGLAGKHPEELDVRERTDAVVVAVQRDGTVVTDFHDDFEIRETDEVIVAGTAEGVEAFAAEFAD